MKKSVGAAAALLVVIAVAGAAQWQLSQGPALPEGISQSNGGIEAVRIAVATKLAGRVAEFLVAEGD